MAEIKGKFVTLAFNFISTKPAAQQAAVVKVQALTGKHPRELEPEAFYDTRVLEAVFAAVKETENETISWIALRVIGREVYYEIKWTVGLPDHLKTPLDFIKFEAEGFLANHRGADVQPRRIISAEEGHVVIQALSPGYDCAFIEGVYEGILRMHKIYDPRVVQTKCVKKGDKVCEYDISW